MCGLDKVINIKEILSDKKKYVSSVSGCPQFNRHFHNIPNVRETLYKNPVLSLFYEKAICDTITSFSEFQLNSAHTLIS